MKMTSLNYVTYMASSCDVTKLILFQVSPLLRFSGIMVVPRKCK